MSSTGSRSGSSSSARRPAPEGPSAVLADANAFFVPLREPVDLVAEVARLAAPAPLAVSSGTLAELDRLVVRGVAGAPAARALAARLPTVRDRGRGDTGLLELAARRSCWVLTGDRALQARLLARGVSVLVPREHRGFDLRRAPTDPEERGARRRAATVKNAPRVEARRRQRGPDAGR